MNIYSLVMYSFMDKLNIDFFCSKKNMTFIFHLNELLFITPIFKANH